MTKSKSFSLQFIQNTKKELNKRIFFIEEQNMHVCVTLFHFTFVVFWNFSNYFLSVPKLGQVLISLNNASPGQVVART